MVEDEDAGSDAEHEDAVEEGVPPTNEQLAQGTDASKPKTKKELKAAAKAEKQRAKEEEKLRKQEEKVAKQEAKAAKKTKKTKK